jgi:hypothetical protein
MTNTAIPPSIATEKTTKLPLYNLVAKIPGPRNFAIKIFLFSFIGTQLPMFALLIYVLMSVELNAEILTTVSIVLITALLGSASTIMALIAYTEPVTAVRKALQNHFALTGANHFVGAFTFGSLSFEQTQHSLELFSKEVMPAFNTIRLAA